LPQPFLIEPETPDTLAAAQAPEMEWVKEMLHSSLHFFFKSARSSARNIALVPVAPEAANRPLIPAVEAAERIKRFIPYRRYNIIVRQ
jgi:hypothetical protein